MTGKMRCGLIPFLIDDEGVARPVRRESTEWELALEFLKDCLQKAGLATDLTDAGWVHSGYDTVEFTKMVKSSCC